MALRLGVTGSRDGITRRQRDALRRYLKLACELHHGDCRGVDEAAHFAALSAKVARIIIHPPTDKKAAANLPGCRKATVGHFGHPQSFKRVDVERLQPKPYIQRNHDIVQAVDFLLVLPSGEEKAQPRSGTWATKRYAEKVGVSFEVVR